MNSRAENFKLNEDDAVSIIQETCEHIAFNPPNFIADAATLPYPKQLVLYACQFLLRFCEELKVRNPNVFLVSDYTHQLARIQPLIEKLNTEWHDIDPEDQLVIARLNTDPKPRYDNEVKEFMPIVTKYMRRALYH